MHSQRGINGSLMRKELILLRAGQLQVAHPFSLEYLHAPESVGDYDFETCYGLIFSVFSNCFNLSLYCVLSDFLFLFLFLNTVLFLNAELMSGAQTCLPFAS